MSIPKLIAVGLAAAATLAALLFLAWPAAVMGQSELALSDFDQDGLEVEALALFIAGDAGSEPALYNVSSRWDASGKLLDGEIGISPDNVPVQRVMSLSGGATLRFNDADGDLSLRDYFGSGGAGYDLTVWVQTAGGSVSFTASGFHSAGVNYVNFAVPSGSAARVADIGAGEHFILALTRPAPEPEPTSPTPSPMPSPSPSPSPSPTASPTPSPTPSPSPAELALSDFDREGLETEALALFVAGDAGSEPALYNVSSRWDASGELLDGDVYIGPGDVPLQRILHQAGSATLRFNDGNAALSLKDYFGTEGPGRHLTIWAQTAGERASFPARAVASAGGNYVNFNVPSGANALFAGIGSGDRFILALTRPAKQSQTETANTPPTFPADTAAGEVAENSAAGTNVGAPVAATDADAGDTLAYTLGGTDAAAFDIDGATGQIRVKSALDHETRSSYSVEVAVSDGKDAVNGTDASVDARVAVAITVADVEEAGAVTFNPTPPRAGTAITASLADPDGDVTGETWQWARSRDRTTWNDIGNATDAAYAPAIADIGYYLRATAIYTDRRGTGKSAAAQTANAVVAANTAPRFPADTAQRAVSENSAIGTAIGTPVAATDADAGDMLTYTLGGTPAAAFDIDNGTGQVRVKSLLDHEAQSSYSMIVTATDQVGDTDTVIVTISVADVEEAGTVTLSPPKAEVGHAITASLTDPDGGVTTTTWQWQKSADKSDLTTNPWTDIPDATNAAYTAIDADDGTHLRAVASYADRRGSGKTALAETLAQRMPEPDRFGYIPVKTVLTARQDGAAILLEWDAIIGNPASYQISRVSSGRNYITVAGTATSHRDTGISPGTSYRYQIRAQYENGNRSHYSRPASVTAAAIAPGVPGPPTGVSAAYQRSDHTITVTWTAPDTAEPVTGYKIDRCVGDGTERECSEGFGRSTTTSWTDSNVTPGSGHLYEVRSIGKGGDSYYSSQVRVDAPELDAPQKPTNLTATHDREAGTVTLQWTPPPDDGPTVTEYLVDRCKEWVGWWNCKEIRTGSTDASYVDDAVSGTRSYQVRSVGTGGISTFSNYAYVVVE